jgi:N-acetyltransferase
MIKFEPVHLETERLLLRPLVKADVAALLAAAADGELWNIRTTFVPTHATTDAYVDRALQQQTDGTALAFVIVLKVSGVVVGTTRFMSIDSANHRVEVGSTWLAKSWQRSFVNSEAKLLMLQHAFETVGCNVVEFRTDVLNAASRAAIERLGAKQEGILRSHIIMPDGRLRDTVIYSILLAEWPAARARLLVRAAPPTPS